MVERIKKNISIMKTRKSSYTSESKDSKNMAIVTRFPPSPTGDLHLGSARTALYNWLYARGNKGKMVLRMEDTDRERSTDFAEKTILEGLKWLGIDYDSGPHRQSQRTERYQSVIKTLLSEDKAYYCYCSRDRLALLREKQLANKQKPRYDGFCRQHKAIDTSAPKVVRFRTPLEGNLVIDDLVKGEVCIENLELDDLIIARSDGSPTYHLTVVVDDIDHEVTHVIRGDDHLNNTPRQIHIIEALGAKRPVYAHIPMVNGPDGQRLSKRHGAASVLEYRELGIIPEALLVYLARLGWSFGDQEIFSIEELKTKFDLSGINRSPAAFDLDKLLWVNQQHIQNMPINRLVEYASDFFDKTGLKTPERSKLEAIVDAQRTRVKTLVEMVEKSRVFLGEYDGLEEKAAKKHLKRTAYTPLTAVAKSLESVPDWNSESLAVEIQATASNLDLKMGKVAQPLRVAVTGTSVSPAIDVTLALLGQDTCLRRIREALEYIEKRDD